MVWAGVPVVSLAGPAKPSRVAASVLLASRCAAALARSLADYPRVAAALVRRAALCHGLGEGEDQGEGEAECGCEARWEVFGGAYFMSRWTRALFAMAEVPAAHIIIPEYRRAR